MHFLTHAECLAYIVCVVGIGDPRIHTDKYDVHACVYIYIYIHIWHMVSLRTCAATFLDLQVACRGRATQEGASLSLSYLVEVSELHEFTIVHDHDTTGQSDESLERKI